SRSAPPGRASATRVGAWSRSEISSTGTSGSGVGAGARSASVGSGVASRLGEAPLVDHSSPFRGTSDLEARLKRPIDRAYSHALVRFLLMRDIDRNPFRRIKVLGMLLGCPTSSTSAW